MVLELQEPGLFRDADVDGQAATHAIVIGVSEYPHLKNGTGPVAQNHFGLGQLAVSALTAYRFFEWLRDRYEYEQAPIGSVRLLLAPNDEELAELPAMVDQYSPANYHSCERGLNDWKQDLGNAPYSSRSVFFFSGHGLEISHQQQVLLPTDWLNEQRPSLNRSLSTLNLKLGLLPLAIPDQFFLIDACRNGSRQLGGAVVEGAQIFDILPPDQNHDEASSHVMYGTASGAQSWQPAQVGEGLSLFGDALLTAVQGGAPVDTEPDPPVVWFEDVASFTNHQIANLLRQRGANVRQTVRVETSFTGFINADVNQMLDVVVRPMGGPARGPGGELLAAGAVGGVDIKQLIRGDYVEPDAGWQTFGPNEDPHTWFGRETLTDVWMGRTIAHELATGQPVDLRIHEVDRFDVVNHRVRLSVESDAAVWLSMDAPNARFATPLPGHRDAVYELSLSWEGEDLVQFDVDLAEGNPYPLELPARLWARYRSSSPDAETSELLESGELERAVGVVQEKVRYDSSPLAAIVSSLVLLHAGTWRSLPERWAHNMATLNAFGDLSDGVVIWAEVLNRLRSKAPVPAGEALALLADRALLPVTNDGVAFASALADIQLATLSADSPFRTPIETVGARLDRLGPVLHPGGLFLVLSGPDIEPSLVYSP